MKKLKLEFIENEVFFLAENYSNQELTELFANLLIEQKGLAIVLSTAIELAKKRKEN